MTGNPYLSVVVPAYQVEPFLVRCLDSILTDTSADIEVVAVNDCSPDGCRLILGEYARRDPRVRLVHLPANVGLGQARNAGLDHATGDYIWFIDGDDWLPAGTVRSVIDRLKTTEPDVLVIDHAEVFDESRPLHGQSGNLLRGLTTPIRLAERPQLLRLAQSACTKVARRAFLADAGLRFRPGWYEDVSFSHPLLMAAGRIDVLDAVCYCYRQRPRGGITRTLSNRHFDVFEQYAGLFELVDTSAGAYDEFRPELFRLMINHYLVIVGNDQRLPIDMRPAFFQRIFEDYRRWRPAAGYPVPPGLTGLRHRLARRGAYRTYAVLRRCYRTGTGLRRRLGVGRRPPVVGPSVASAEVVAEPLAGLTAIGNATGRVGARTRQCPPEHTTSRAAGSVDLSLPAPKLAASRLSRPT